MNLNRCYSAWFLYQKSVPDMISPLFCLSKKQANNDGYTLHFHSRRLVIHFLRGSQLACRFHLQGYDSSRARMWQWLDINFTCRKEAPLEAVCVLGWDRGAPYPRSSTGRVVLHPCGSARGTAQPRDSANTTWLAAPPHGQPGAAVPK